MEGKISLNHLSKPGAFNRQNVAKHLPSPLQCGEGFFLLNDGEPAYAGTPQHPAAADSALYAALERPAPAVIIPFGGQSKLEYSRIC